MTNAERDRPPIFRWIKTECGRAKYTELSSRRGFTAKARLYWFVGIAALRDWQLPDPGQISGS